MNVRCARKRRRVAQHAGGIMLQRAGTYRSFHRGVQHPMQVFGHCDGAGYRPANTAALARCRAAGVDGVFCDYPDRVLAERHRD